MVGALPLQAVREDAASRRPGVRIDDHLRGVRVVRMERDDRGVAVAAAGHADVQRCAVGAAVGHDVAPVADRALRGLHRTAIGKLDVRLDVAGRAARG
jgi:methylmalonyl-CoA mutase cobalamin-binding subunit